MSIIFVSRHPGAVEWARRRGFPVDAWVPHLQMQDVKAGDAVLGTLPIPMVAQVCERGASYWHLALSVPPEWRGLELQADQLEALGAELLPFRASRGES